MLGNANNYKNPTKGVMEIPVTKQSIGCEVSRDSSTNVWSRLDELDVCLQQLKEQVETLNYRLDGVQSSAEREQYPVPGPRTSNSNLESRICAQSDFVDDLTRYIEDIKRRLTV
jgi:hypothetical protein